MDVTVTIRPAAEENREDAMVDLIRGLKSNILSLHITLLLHTFEVAGIDGVEELPGRT